MNVIAGCSASGRAPTAAAGASTASPCAPEVCATTCPGRNAPASGQAAHQRAEGVVGNGDEHQVGVVGDLVRSGSRRAVRQQAFDAGQAGGRDAGGGDHPVTGGRQCRAEHGADAAGADDADAKMTCGRPAWARATASGPSARTASAHVVDPVLFCGVPVVCKYVPRRGSPYAPCGMFHDVSTREIGTDAGGGLRRSTGAVAAGDGGGAVRAARILRHGSRQTRISGPARTSSTVFASALLRLVVDTDEALGRPDPFDWWTSAPVAASLLGRIAVLAPTDLRDGCG